LKRVSNWSRWGKDDQLGTLNLITPEKRREAVALVRAGVSVSLARDLNTEKAINNPDPFRDTMNLVVDGKFNMDTYTVNFHGFAFTTSTRFLTLIRKAISTTAFQTLRLPRLALPCSIPLSIEMASLPEAFW